MTTNETAHTVLADYNDEWDEQNEPNYTWTIAHSHPRIQSHPDFPNHAIYPTAQLAQQRADCILDHTTIIEERNTDELHQIIKHGGYTESHTNQLKNRLATIKHNAQTAHQIWLALSTEGQKLQPLNHQETINKITQILNQKDGIDETGQPPQKHQLSIYCTDQGTTALANGKPAQLTIVATNNHPNGRLHQILIEWEGDIFTNNPCPKSK